MKHENYSNVRCAHNCTVQKKQFQRSIYLYRDYCFKKSIDISLKQATLCSLWDSKRECINRKTPEDKQINKFVDDTRYRLMECYQQLLPEHKVISPHTIKTLYLGETKIDNTLPGLMDYHNTDMKPILSWGMLKNYFTTRKYMHLFLTKKHNIHSPCVT